MTGRLPSLGRGLLLTGLLLSGASEGPAQERPGPARPAPAGPVGAAREPQGLARLPYRTGPVHYFAESDNAVARLQRKWQMPGDDVPRPGDLSALLKVLEISESSQLLVFARNARQGHQISPDNPRAIYFNDEVSVAWTPGSNNYEISGLDPRRGPVFYLASVAELHRYATGKNALGTNDTGTDTPERRHRAPLFQRTESCLACHVAETTRHVPGYLLRSMFTNPEGKPESGLPLVDHTTPYDQRWGGWYVSGEQLPPRHRGNLTTAAARQIYETGLTAVPLATGQMSQATMRHLQSTSDVVALLVHDHQTRFQTLLTRLRYEHELERPLDTLPDFVRTLVLWDESPLPQPVAGREDYRAWFESAGPADFRPLRQLDLRTRLLRQPLSWLVSTPQFQQLPAPLRQAIHVAALRLVTAASDPPATWSADDRRLLTEELLPRFTGGGSAVGGLVPAAQP